MNEDTRIALLAAQLDQTLLFRGLSEAVRQRIAAQGRLRSFAPKTAIFHEGDPGHLLYVLLGGAVRIERIGPDGALRILAERREGDHVGEQALLDDGLRSATVTTLKSTRTFCLRRDELLALLKAEPELALHLIHSLSNRLRETEERVQIHESRSLAERVAFVLARRVRVLGSEGGAVSLGVVSDRELGAEVGAARESVTRSIGQLKTRKLVERDGRSLIVLHPERLEAFAEGTRE